MNGRTVLLDAAVRREWLRPPAQACRSLLPVQGVELSSVIVEANSADERIERQILLNLENLLNVDFAWFFFAEKVRLSIRPQSRNRPACEIPKDHSWHGITINFVVNANWRVSTHRSSCIGQAPAFTLWTRHSAQEPFPWPRLPPRAACVLGGIRRERRSPADVEAKDLPRDAARGDDSRSIPTRS